MPVGANVPQSIQYGRLVAGYAVGSEFAEFRVNGGCSWSGTRLLLKWVKVNGDDDGCFRWGFVVYRIGGVR